MIPSRRPLSVTTRTAVATALMLSTVAGAHRWWTKPLRSASPAPPDLPGQRRTMWRKWGEVAYRIHVPDPSRPVTVLIHGWSGSGDASWWRIIQDPSMNFIAIDLPGHGFSTLDRRFTFELAATAVHGVLVHEDLIGVTLVGSSMGGPIALEVLQLCQQRQCTTHVQNLVMVATSAYWVRPRAKLLVGLAPYLASDFSPLPAAVLRANNKATPDWSDIHAWGLHSRPSRKILAESSQQLRRFDMRDRYDQLAYVLEHLNSFIWVVTTRDGVIKPTRQYTSAEMYHAQVVEVPSHHAVLFDHAPEINELLHSITTRPPSYPVVDPQPATA